MRRRRRPAPEKKSISSRLAGVVDDAVAILSPQRAVRRRAFRDLYEFRGPAYDAANREDPDMEEWSPGNPVTDAWSDLETSRNRARDRERNAGQARARADIDQRPGDIRRHDQAIQDMPRHHLAGLAHGREIVGLVPLDEQLDISAQRRGQPRAVRPEVRQTLFQLCAPIRHRVLHGAAQYNKV